MAHDLSKAPTATIQQLREAFQNKQAQIRNLEYQINKLENQIESYLEIHGNYPYHLRHQLNEMLDEQRRLIGQCTNCED